MKPNTRVNFHCREHFYLHTRVNKIEGLYRRSLNFYIVSILFTHLKNYAAVEIHLYRLTSLSLGNVARSEASDFYCLMRARALLEEREPLRSNLTCHMSS